MVAGPIHRVGLVSCGAAKRDHEAPARDLYVGGLFRAAAGYAEATYDSWWIVSAFHGLVHPDKVLFPYDRSLADMRQRERDAWGGRVAEALRWQLQGRGLRVPIVPKPRPWPHEPEVEVWIHAGKAYAEALLWPLSLWPSIVQRPLAGLGIGQQLAWYAQRRPGAA